MILIITATQTQVSFFVLAECVKMEEHSEHYTEMSRSYVDDNTKNVCVFHSSLLKINLLYRMALYCKRAGVVGGSSGRSPPSLVL